MVEYQYTSCFCEENIYLLAKSFHKGEMKEQLHEFEGYVVFITNSDQCVPIWNQKLRMNSESPVWWDYHVVLLVKSKEASYIFDFDTVLGFQTNALFYIENSMRPDLELPQHARQVVICHVSFHDTQ